MSAYSATITVSGETRLVGQAQKKGQAQKLLDAYLAVAMACGVDISSWNPRVTKPRKKAGEQWD